MLNTIILIIPVLLLVTLAEWYIGYRRNEQTYTTGNYVMNLSIGAMDQVASLIYFTALYFSLDFVYRHFRLFELSNAWYNWVTAYIAVDFLSYWYHRFSHRINILWAGHVTHHSSEHFNYSNGFRTSFFQGVNRILFWSVLPVFGFGPLMLLIILKVSGLYDFLLHTTLIPKLGVLEKILITPSQHRVHHGRNDLYIDKNYGSTFVIWDKLFGTFQEETEPVEYGIKGPYVDNNPYNAIGYYYRYLWLAMKKTPALAGKIKLLFLPPEQTPKPDLPATLPIDEHAAPMPLRFYAWFQVSTSVSGLIMLLLFKNYLSGWDLMLYALMGISATAVSARILLGNIRDTFATSEFIRLSLCIIMLATVMLLHPAMFQVAVLFQLVISFMLQAFMQHPAESGRRKLHP